MGMRGYADRAPAARQDLRRLPQGSPRATKTDCRIEKFAHFGVCDVALSVQTSHGGEVVYVVDGPSLADPKVVVKYALRKPDLAAYVERRQLALLAQFATLVADGLILSKHCFNGLRRDLYCDGEQDGHLKKFALVRKPAYDYVWEGGRQGSPVRKVAPPDSVFVVLVSRNAHKAEFPDVEGWLDRWSWVREDQGPLDETPEGWVDRYESKVWTRE